MTNHEWFELNYPTDEQITYVTQKCPPGNGEYPFCRHACDNITCDECW